MVHLYIPNVFPRASSVLNTPGAGVVTGGQTNQVKEPGEIDVLSFSQNFGSQPMAHLSTGPALTPGQMPLSQGKTPSMAAEAVELRQNRPGQNQASFS